MSKKQTISINIDVSTIELIKALALDIDRSVSWTINHLLLVAIKGGEENVKDSK